MKISKIANRTKAKLIIIAIAMSICTYNYAQTIDANEAASIATAGTKGLSVAGNLCGQNPSQTANTNGLEAIIGYTCPYALKELNQNYIHAAYGNSMITIEGRIQRSGNDLSSYTTFGIAAARYFGTKWALGLRYNWLIHKLPYNESYQAGYSQFGIHYKPSDEWTVASTIQNIERNTIEYKKYATINIPTIAIFSIKWSKEDLISIYGEVEKDFDRDPIGKIALRMQTIKYITATVGVAGKPMILSAGAGFLYKKISIEVGISHHQDLGITSGATFAISNIFNKQ